jgi:uncharacterized membrane protein
MSLCFVVTALSVLLLFARTIQRAGQLALFRTVTLSSMHAMIFTAPPQCSHTVTSIRKTRFKRCAHVMAI